MKKVLAILGILLVLFVGLIWFFYFRGGKKHDGGPKPRPITVSKHSPDFNRSADSVLGAYFAMTEAFVNWDTAAADRSATELLQALNHLRINELQKDPDIYQTCIAFLDNAKSETDNIINQPGIDRKRQALNMLTDNLRTLFIAFKYDQGKIYYQECPMAFGEDNAGYWLSPSVNVRNPYLGNKHPQLGASMLQCGGPKDTINFIQPDSTRVR